MYFICMVPPTGEKGALTMMAAVRQGVKDQGRGRRRIIKVPPLRMEKYQYTRETSRSRPVLRTTKRRTVKDGKHQGEGVGG